MIEVGIEQMMPMEDQHAVVGDGREQTELEDGTDGNKEGHLKYKSDESNRGKSYCC